MFIPNTEDRAMFTSDASVNSVPIPERIDRVHVFDLKMQTLSQQQHTRSRGDDSTRSVNQSAILMCLMCRRCRRPCRRRLHLDIDVVMLHLGADVTSEI